MGDVHVVGKVHSTSWVMRDQPQSVGWRLLMVIDPFLGDPWKKAPFMGVTSGAHLWWMESNSQLYIHIYIYKLFMSVWSKVTNKQHTYIHIYRQSTHKAIAVASNKGWRILYYNIYIYRERDYPICMYIYIYVYVDVSPSLASLPIPFLGHNTFRSGPPARRQKEQEPDGALARELLWDVSRGDACLLAKCTFGLCSFALRKFRNT